jgi:hypothetical protein
MRKSLWIILAVLFVAIAAPHAHADTSSSFTVAGDATNLSGATLALALMARIARSPAP